jgi:hypothetical protein
MGASASLCGRAASWPLDLRVAVNLSAVQFKNRTLAQIVFNALAMSGLAANRLELEITESVLLQDSEATLAILHQLRDLGVRIALDDFGTGYSSLSYLRSFPFDKIKIDRCFVADLSNTGGRTRLPLCARWHAWATRSECRPRQEGSKPRSNWSACGQKGAPRSRATSSVPPSAPMRSDSISPAQRQ